MRCCINKTVSICSDPFELPLNPDCKASWHVSGKGDNKILPGGVFGLGWIKGAASFEDVVLPCEWPVGEATVGSMTFMGMRAATGLALSASAVHMSVGDFMAWDWFGADGVHIWIAGGGMVVNIKGVSRGRSCNE